MFNAHFNAAGDQIVSDVDPGSRISSGQNPVPDCRGPLAVLGLLLWLCPGLMPRPMVTPVVLATSPACKTSRRRMLASVSFQQTDPNWPSLYALFPAANEAFCLLYCCVLFPIALLSFASLHVISLVRC